MTIADFRDYCRAQDEASAVYRQPQRFFEMSLVNTAKSGVFSADRAIHEYAERIWHV